MYLLSAPLTILLGCGHINRFRRASRCGEATARRRKEERRAGLASRGMCRDEVVSPPVCGHRGAPARSGVPEQCHASGATVDVCSDTPAWVQRAGRAANGGVVDVPRALAGAPRAPRMTAQRGARFAPLSYPQLLATTAMTSRETVGVISRPKSQSVDRTAPLPS